MEKLKHYDNSTMHTLGHFTSMVETEHKYIVADIVVADCIKTHGLIGNDLLDINPLHMRSEQHHIERNWSL